MSVFARARIEKLIRDVGAQRVSDSAIKELNDVLTTQGIRIAGHAVKFAKQEGRRTVKAKDIERAALIVST